MNEMNNGNFNYDPYTGQPVNRQVQNTNYNGTIQDLNFNKQPKKKNPTCLIVGIVFGLLTLFVGAIFVLLIIIGLSVKEPITSIEFAKHLKNEGYKVSYEEDLLTPELSMVLSATNEDYSCVLFFAEAYKDSGAESFYVKEKKVLSDKYNIVSQTEQSGTSYCKYTATTQTKYFVVSFIDNTVIFVEADKEYKEEIKDILKELNY